MLKIKFMDKTEQEYENAIETEEYFNGSYRRTLTFEIDRNNVNLETLDKELNGANIESLKLCNTENKVENIYDGYVLKLGLGIKQKLVNADTNEYAEYVELKLGKRTYIEQRLHELGL